MNLTDRELDIKIASFLSRKAEEFPEIFDEYEKPSIIQLIKASALRTLHR